MCGRFTQKYTWSAELYALTQPPSNLEPRYNIAPTTTIDVVRVHDGEREVVRMRWRLRQPLMRAETVADKPMFRMAFKRFTLHLPASSNYEWKTINGTKQPLYLAQRMGGIQAIAGLWDEWNDRSSPAGVSSLGH